MTTTVSTTEDKESARRIMLRCDELTKFSRDSSTYCRTYLTPEQRAAADWLGEKMREAGMTVREDAVGNVIGRYEAQSEQARAVILGSHFDTVPDAGRYDGNLGVITAIECVATLALARRRLPFAIEVYAFADEEGTRFTTGFLTSSAVVDGIVNFPLRHVDQDGMSVADAFEEYGLSVENINTAKRRSDEFLAYIELHIEQGPVLEENDLAICPVTSIAGQTRLSITIDGKAGHAGTVPMSLRRDALAGAAEMIIEVERVCRADDRLVGTVGTVNVSPGALNVIPGEVEFGIDIRSADDSVRQPAVDKLLTFFRATAKKRGLEITTEVKQTTPAVACDSWLLDIIDAACADITGRSLQLYSGAGHDAAIMASLCPAGLIFVRCKDGISHHPAESITLDDADVAFRAMMRALERLADSPTFT
ncbi:MAG: allantoate amidohydrolase [Methyloligellaceae bacterium]